MSLFGKIRLRVARHEWGFFFRCARLNGGNLGFVERFESLACLNRGGGQQCHRVDDVCNWSNWEDLLYYSTCGCGRAGV